MFFPHRIMSRVLALSLSLLFSLFFLAACIEDDPFEMDDVAALTVSITAAPTELFESEWTMLTLTLMLSEVPPAGGVNVTIESDTPNALRELDVLAAVYTGARLVAGNADRSGFTLSVFELTATVTLPVFDDGVPEGPETLTFGLVPSEAYAIDPEAHSISITIFDTAP